MKFISKTGSIQTKSVTKAGGFGPSNHNRALKTGALKVRVTAKAGGFGPSNHNRALKV